MLKMYQTHVMLRNSLKKHAILENITNLYIITGSCKSILIISTLLTFVYSGYLYAHMVLCVIIYMFLCKNLLSTYICEKDKKLRKILTPYIIVLTCVPLIRYTANLIIATVEASSDIIEKNLSLINITTELILFLFTTLIFLMLIDGKLRILACMILVIMVIMVVIFRNFEIRPFTYLVNHSKEATVRFVSVLYYLVTSVGYIIIGTVLKYSQ